MDVRGIGRDSKHLRPRSFHRGSDNHSDSLISSAVGPYALSDRIFFFPCRSKEAVLMVHKVGRKRSCDRPWYSRFARHDVTHSQCSRCLPALIQVLVLWSRKLLGFVTETNEFLAAKG